MSSISFLEKQFADLSIHQKKPGFSETIQTMSKKLESLTSCLEHLSLTSSSAPSIKENFNLKLKELTSLNTTPVESNSSLDLATPLTQRQTSKPSLEYLHLELPLLSSHRPKYPGPLCLYDACTSLERKAHQKKLQELIFRVEDAFKIYVFVSIDMIAQADPKVLDPSTALELPKKTTFFVKEKIKDIAYNATLLTQGGYGSVLKLQSKDPAHLFALKTPLPSTKKSSLYEKAIINESLILLQINHPNIVSLAALTTLENFGTSLILDYIKGPTLHQSSGLLSYKHPSPVKHMQDVALALNYLHKKHIIHKDVKPKNILINPQDRAILLDFGLSSHTQQADVINGTPGYFAPELFSIHAQQLCSAKIDVYSFGVSLFEVLSCGQMPYPPKAHEPKRAYIDRIARETLNKPCDLKTIKKHLNIDSMAEFFKRDPKGDLSKIMVKCLNGIAAQRPTIKAVCEDLSKITF